MTKNNSELSAIILGMLASTALGPILFNALGTFLLGILGAAGGYMFNKFIKPRIDFYFQNKNKKNDEKAG